MNEHNTFTAALELDANAISAANAASQFDAGSVLAREAQSVYESGLADLEPCQEWTQAQHEYAVRRAVEWRDLVQKAYNDIIRRRASWMPWTVCGPARYNQRKNDAKADAQMNAKKEWSEKFSRFRANSIQQLVNLRPAADQIARYRNGSDTSAISADDPLALEKLTARIDYLKEEHTRNLELNKHYRKYNTMRGAPGIDDANADKLDAELAELPKCMRCIGFSSNETANIRRLEERRATLEKARAAAAEHNAPKTFDGFRIEQDADANRVRIFFDDKPDEETRAMLKSNGFRWSPNAGAWQRQLNANGLHAARRVADALAPHTQDEEPAFLTLDEFAEKYAAE